jgi:hypothetical protein
MTERTRKLVIFLLVAFIGIPVLGVIVINVTNNSSPVSVSTVAVSAVSDRTEIATREKPAVIPAQTVVKEEPFLFRDMPWGTSREDVIAKEGGKFTVIPSDESEMLVYQNIRIGGENTAMGLIIDPEHGLSGAIYFFSINTDGFPYNTKPFIDAYSRLYSLLSDIYGSPAPGSQSAKSEGDDLSDFMEYYYKGGRTARWNQKGTTVYLSLNPKKPEDFDLADWSLSVSYSSPRMKESGEAEKRSGL